MDDIQKINPKNKFFDYLKIIAIGSVLIVVTFVIFHYSSTNLSGKNVSTGDADFLSDGHVIPDYMYYKAHPNQHTYNGFLYDDALNLTIGFGSDETLQAFMDALKPLQTEVTSEKLTTKFTGNHIDYNGTWISTADFTELHKDNKATFINCYLPDELLHGSIRAYDSKAELDSDTRECS